MDRTRARRISAVAGVPGDTTIYYMGAASGGIWKTTDGACTFAPIFDGQPVLKAFNELMGARTKVIMN